MRADGSIAPALIRFDEYASKSERERQRLSYTIVRAIGV